MKLAKNRWRPTESNATLKVIHSVKLGKGRSVETHWDPSKGLSVAGRPFCLETTRFDWWIALRSFCCCCCCCCCCWAAAGAASLRSLFLSFFHPLVLAFRLAFRRRFGRRSECRERRLSTFENVPWPGDFRRLFVSKKKLVKKKLGTNGLASSKT